MQVVDIFKQDNPLSDMFKQSDPISEDYVFRVFMSLVNAVQEQQQLIKELKKKNADMEKMLLPAESS